MPLAYIDPGSGFTVFTLGGFLIAFLGAFLGIFLVFFKKNRRMVLIFLLIATALSLIIGVAMNKKGSDFNKRIIILGFDGLSPEIIEPMMKKGELANFSRLKEEGSYRRLSTTNPSQSPVAWTGFATGQNPGKNGIFDFIIRDPKTYGLRLAHSNTERGKPKRTVRTKCFWHYTSEKKVPTTIITCPVTFPPDKVTGSMLSGMGVPDILGTEGTFTFYTTEPLGDGKDYGGKVFQVEKSSEMNMNLIGPKVAGVGGKAENAKVPFKVFLREGGGLTVEYQEKRFQLNVGEWSGWKEVTFKLGLLKEMKGIFKLYLVETEPELKLYITPINIDPRSPFFDISYPKGYSKELADAIGLYYTQGMPMQTWAVNEKRLSEEPFLDEVNEVLREKTAMLDFEFKRFKKGILFCYFESPDIIQHMFWRYIDPGHPLYEEDAPLRYKKTIESWYKKMDDILDTVMQRIDKEDILIVLSDHGFNTFRRAVHVNTWLRENGYLELKDKNAKTGSELLKDIDWSKTKAYALGFGAVYLNQRGRERDGIVSPGREAELLKEEISKKLELWIDEKHEKNVINKVYKREEIFWGDYADNTPDLYIGFNIGYRASWQTALGGVAKALIEDNLKKWSGSHLCDPSLIPGILFTNKKIIKQDPSMYDMAPTILKIVGFEDEELKKYNFDGEPLF